MPADDGHQSWELTVDAHFSNFKLKFKAAEVHSPRRFHRLSFLLKLPKFIIRWNSESETSGPIQPRRPLRSKLLSFLYKIGVRRQDEVIKRAAVEKPNPWLSNAQPFINRLRWFYHQKSVWVGTLAAGIGSLAAQYKLLKETKSKNGMVGLTTLIWLALITVNKYKRERERERTGWSLVLAVAMVPMVAWSMGLAVDEDVKTERRKGFPILFGSRWIKL